jgi:hypothetical protein
MSHTHGSIERLKQALMMLCTHLIYGICSGENGIYWMERGGEKSQHNCVSQREAMLGQFWPTLERVIITDRNLWCLFRFQLIRSLGYWCTTYCLSQRKRRPNSRNFSPARDEVSRFAIPIHIGNAADQQANLWSLIGRSDECDVVIRGVVIEVIMVVGRHLLIEEETPSEGQRMVSGNRSSGSLGIYLGESLERKC